MCGAFSQINDPFMKSIAIDLGVDEIHCNGFSLPTSAIKMITQDDHDRYVEDAKWWLLQSAGMPDSYATFNTRNDKLFGDEYGARFFKRSRCIIPASFFIEGKGAQGNKTYHKLEGADHAIAFGGLYAENHWQGQSYYSASIITCPGNPKFKDIHPARIPLMLDHEDDDLIDDWLNPNITNTDLFHDLLNGSIPLDIVATKIKAARDITPIADSFRIQADV